MRVNAARAANPRQFKRLVIACRPRFPGDDLVSAFSEQLWNLPVGLSESLLHGAVCGLLCGAPADSAAGYRRALTDLLDDASRMDEDELDRFIEFAADDPSSHEARVSLGSALSARGRDDEALIVFRALAEENDAEGWYNLGTILARRGGYPDAVDAFRRALAIDPSMGPARHNLGVALVRSGRLDEAIVVLRECATAEPDSEGAIYTLGVALLTSGDRVAAAKCVGQLEALGTSQATVLANRLAGSVGAP